MLKTITILFVLMIASTAVAQEGSGDVRSFLSIIETNGKYSRSLLTRLHDNAEGMGWANAVLNQQGLQPLFCAPRKMAFTPEQYLSIFRNYVENRPELMDMHSGIAGGILLNALREIFPCDQ